MLDDRGNSSDRWWIVAASASATAVILAVALWNYPTSKFVWLATLAVAVFAAVMYRHPARRYWRAASCLFALAGTTAIVPTMTAELVSPQYGSARFLTESSPWVPIAFLVAAVVMSWLDAGQNGFSLFGRERPQPSGGTKVVHSPGAFPSITAGRDVQYHIYMGPDQRAGAHQDGQPEPPRPPAVSANELKPLLRSASKPLLVWPTTLDRGERLEQPELGQVADSIDEDSTSTTLVLGQPGSGKSAMLAELAVQFERRGTVVLALKADVLPETVRDGDTLSHFLGTPAPLGIHILNIAATEKVVVLIDQLDALADLVDLRSNRLNTLLNLVREIAGRPNVHVVCSCREFEYRHDARLTAIDAETVTLSLPTWDQVAAILKSRNVPTDGWQDDFREMLRIPQRLKVFLQRLNHTSEHQVFSSYQLMLDDLWEKRVTDLAGPPGRSALVSSIAAEMADRESLWIPKALFEDRQELLKRLIDAGILIESPGGTSIGFAHQTLFEHARSRAFARGEQSLWQLASLSPRPRWPLGSSPPNSKGLYPASRLNRTRSRRGLTKAPRRIR